MNNKINIPVTLKQYNLDTNKMSTTIPKKEAKNLVQNLSIKSILQSLSLSVNKTNQNIVSELLNHDLPLNKELISDLNDFISNLANQDSLETKVKIALLLKKIDMPLNKKFYNFFKNHLLSKTDLKDNIKELIQQLSNNNLFKEQNGIQIKENNNFPKTLENFIEQETTVHNPKKSDSSLKINHLQSSSTLSKTKLNEILNKLDLAPTKENRAIIKILFDYKLKINKDNWQKLKNLNQTNQNLTEPNKQLLTELAFAEKLDLSSQNLFKEINFNPQTKLEDSLLKLGKLLITQNTEQENINLTKLTTKIKNLITKEPELLLKLKENFPKNNFNKLATKLDLTKNEQNNTLQKGLRKELLDTIISANNLELNSIKQSINKLNLENDKQLVKFLFRLSEDASSEKLQEKTEDLTKQLLNLKTVNYETENTLLFLPVLFKENLELAQIKFKQKRNKEHTEDNSFKFAFKVDTEKLGALEVKVKIKNEQLKILFLVESSSSKEVIDKNLDSLQKAFQDHDYTINYLECKLQHNKDKEEQEEQSLTAIDYTI
ncbi:MAG: flagellar hook-length control protein FliK [Halanaerobacter sp.]